MGESKQVNRALWLESFDSTPHVKEIPVPEAGPGSVVVRVYSNILPPYTKLIHDGTLPVYNLFLPLVPGPGHIGRVQSTGPDAVLIKPGDLVYFDPWVTARDDRSSFIIQGHHGGEGLKGKKLMQGEWKNGAMQQLQKVPTENLVVLDENRLCKQLGYSIPEIHEIALQAMVVGALCDAGQTKAGETVIVGPATGTFGAAAVELALVLGANVVALGRDQQKLEYIHKKLGSPYRLRYVVMSGDVDKDSAAILAATPEGKGAEVFNDWTSGTLQTPPFFEAALKAVKVEGRVVLSGAPSGNVPLSYTYTMHNNISIIGKMMVTRAGIEQTINMIASGFLKIGRQGGATVKVFSLDEHEEAIETAFKHGGWKHYIYINPNKEMTR